MKRNKEQNYLMRDLGIVALSFIIAVALVKTRMLDDILFAAQEMKVIGSFLAGMFYISIFTVAPAAVVLAELTQKFSLWEVAFFGGLGALAGDLLIFQFIKNSLARDIFSLLPQPRRRRWSGILKTKLFRWLTPFIGALIIASPLPDEAGLALMGVSRLKMSIFIPLSFILNFLGILAVCLAAMRFF
jgi:hypothetical protein